MTQSILSPIARYDEVRVTDTFTTFVGTQQDSVTLDQGAHSVGPGEGGTLAHRCATTARERFGYPRDEQIWGRPQATDKAQVDRGPGVRPIATLGAMTTNVSPDEPSSPVRLSLSSTGDLLAAVPALLGFVPHRSVVLMCLSSTGRGTAEVGPVLRHDLAYPDLPAGAAAVHGRELLPVMHSAVERFGDYCRREYVEAAFLVLVDETTSPAHDLALGSVPDLDAVVDAIDVALHNAGTHLVDAFLVQGFTGGGSWASFVTSADGSLPDHTTSAATAAYVYGGGVLHESRSDLARVVEPAPEALVALVRTARDISRNRVAQMSDATLVDMLTGHVTALTTGTRASLSTLPGPTALAEMSLAMRRLTVRDAGLSLSVGEHAEAAHELWLHLTRVVEGRDRAAPATVLGFSAYVRGEGPLASVAFEAALTADPHYNMAQMLLTALTGGMHPTEIRQIAPPVT